MSKSTQRSGTGITCIEVVDLCERIYTENPDLPVVGARVLGLFLCVWLGPPWGATCPRRCSPPTLTHDTLVGFGEVGVRFRWYSGVGGLLGH